MKALLDEGDYMVNRTSEWSMERDFKNDSRTESQHYEWVQPTAAAINSNTGDAKVAVSNSDHDSGYGDTTSDLFSDQKSTAHRASRDSGELTYVSLN